MVNGVTICTAGNAQLAWSRDRGQTWSWSDWTFTTSFGAPTFLNFGCNYAGARVDSSTCIPTIWTAPISLPTGWSWRVLSSRIRDRQAYEFFKGLDGRGQPIWTPAIEERGAVFTSPARCYRSGISYNAGLRRYIWSQTLPGERASRRIRCVRCAGAVGTVDHGVLHGALGCRTRRDQLVPDEVDERGRKNHAPRVLGRRCVLRPEGDDQVAISCSYQPSALTAEALAKSDG